MQGQGGQGVESSASGDYDATEHLGGGILIQVCGFWQQKYRG